MEELYRQLGSYKEVGKKMRRSPSTVSKYLGIQEVAKQVGHYYDNLISIRYGRGD